MVSPVQPTSKQGRSQLQERRHPPTLSQDCFLVFLAWLGCHYTHIVTLRDRPLDLEHILLTQ